VHHRGIRLHVVSNFRTARSGRGLALGVRRATPHPLTTRPALVPVEATIGGMTPETPPRYVTFHFAGAPYRHGDDAWCDELAKGTGRD
jgi:hypothetical protein